ncbi:MAG: response regulator [Gemmataceae bacterium]|nr:response regulator [Gemmataceae bacterium]MCI0737720.1 response regulator [Gemmataceae bacterium]
MQATKTDYSLDTLAKDRPVRLERWYLSCLVVALILLAAIGWLTVRGMRQLLQAFEQHRSALEVLVAMEELETALYETENARLGFALTGAASFRRMFDELHPTVAIRFEKLQALVPEATSKIQLEGLRPKLDKNLSAMSSALEHADAKMLSRQIEWTNEIQKQRTEIRAELQHLRAFETGVVTERAHEAQGRYKAAVLTTVAASALGTIIILLSVVFLLREFKARRTIEGELQIFNEELTRRVEERTQDLLASEARYRRLIEFSPDGIMIQRDLKILFVNRAAEVIFGGSAAEILGKSPMEFVHPEFHAVVRERIAFMLKQGAQVPTLEQKILGLDGKAREVEITSCPFTEKEGTSILVLMRDVTERKRMEARFLRAQRLESIGTLAGGIAHDLNNVLTPILMAVKLLQKPRPDDERQALLETAQASVQRGSDMIKQLLAFTGGLETQRVPVEPKTVLREVHALLVRTIPKSVQLQLLLPDDLWVIGADATQLLQVFMNLCVNARDAMPDGGVLTISAENIHIDAKYQLVDADAKPGDYVLFRVKDTGTGMTPEIRDKIFDPFFTTKETGKGTGLGLSTAVGIVRSHGGFISVYSEPNQGASFNVYLPALERPRAEDAKAAAKEPPRGRGELILVVDDEEFIRFTATTFLEANGYRTLTAKNGVEALDIFRERRAEIRAVFLDVMMPEMDGIATLAEMRKLEPDVRVAAASGLHAANRVAEVTAAGAKAFLAKPYSDEQLLQTLAKVLQ